MVEKLGFLSAYFQVTFDDNARSKKVPLKALSDQAWIRYPCFFITAFSFAVSQQKWHISWISWKIIRFQHFLLINRHYLPHFWSELGTFEWWISGLRLNPLFFLISRLNFACSPLIFNLQINYPIRIKDIPF